MRASHFLAAAVAVSALAVWTFALERGLLPIPLTRFSQPSDLHPLILDEACVGLKDGKPILVPHGTVEIEYLGLNSYSRTDAAMAGDPFQIFRSSLIQANQKFPRDGGEYPFGTFARIDRTAKSALYAANFSVRTRSEVGPDVYLQTTDEELVARYINALGRGDSLIVGHSASGKIYDIRFASDSSPLRLKRWERIDCSLDINAIDVTRVAKPRKANNAIARGAR